MAAGQPPQPGPPVLERGEAEQLAAHLATDLAPMLPEVGRLSLTTVGAWYDQCQLLRPGFPLFDALARYDRQAASGHPMARVLSIGAHQGQLPDPALVPDPQIPLGDLWLMPLLLTGEVETVRQVGLAAESRLLEEGQVSAHTAAWMEQAFATGAGHIRVLSWTDFYALWRLQLEHVGALGLWQLIDASLEPGAAPLRVETTSGNVFEQRAGQVTGDFVSFDQWQPPVARDRVASYLDWTRGMRQFGAVLAAHRVPLTWQGEGLIIEPDYVVERLPRPATESAAVTEHHDPALGLVATSIRCGRSQMNCYPISRHGPRRIGEYLRQLMPSPPPVRRADTLLHDPQDGGLTVAAGVLH